MLISLLVQFFLHLPLFPLLILPQDQIFGVQDSVLQPEFRVAEDRENISTHLEICNTICNTNTEHFSHIEVDRLRYLQSEPALAMDVDPVRESGVGTDVAEVVINPGHLAGALPAQAAEETQAAGEEEKVVEPADP